MQFKIPCSTFARLANAAIPQPNETRHHINCIRFENVNGACYAIATNALIAAIEHLGNTEWQDYGICIARDPALIAQCESEASFDSELTIDVIINDIMKFASAKTTFGYTHPDNVLRYPPDGMDHRPWNDFRSLVPDEMPSKSAGFLFMDTEQITNLGKASPSGRLVFPKFIDSSKPVLVRDAVDPAWLGLFLPRDNGGSQDKLKPATRPEWI